MDSKTKTIGIIPFGEIPEIVSKIIAGNIIAYLNLSVEIIPPAKNPAFAFDDKRLQYDAGIILMNLESRCLNNYEKVIGILDADLFVPIFSHVFGEAKQGGKYALVSLFRLKKIRTDPPLCRLFFMNGRQRWPFMNWVTFIISSIARINGVLCIFQEDSKISMKYLFIFAGTAPLFSRMPF